MTGVLLTDNGRKVLSFMKDSSEEIFVGKDLGDVLNIKGIYLVLLRLCKNGLVTSAEPIKREFTNSKGVIQLKEYKTYCLTECGKNFLL